VRVDVQRRAVMKGKTDWETVTVSGGTATFTTSTLKVGHNDSQGGVRR